MSESATNDTDYIDPLAKLKELRERLNAYDEENDDRSVLHDIAIELLVVGEFLKD